MGRLAATPHFATQHAFSHMGLSRIQREMVTMTYYEAGHMMYVHTPSREKLAGDMREVWAKRAARPGRSPLADCAIATHREGGHRSWGDAR